LASSTAIWSKQTPAKSANMISARGRRPRTAAPIAQPTIACSEIGVSSTRSGPKRANSPSLVLNAPPAAPTSSPIRNTSSSAASASPMARVIACL
jgi:hypothetical protein